MVPNVEGYELSSPFFDRLPDPRSQKVSKSGCFGNRLGRINGQLTATGQEQASRYPRVSPLSMQNSEFLTCVGFVIWHLEDGHNFDVTRVHGQVFYMFN